MEKEIRKPSFVFYASYYEAIKELDTTTQLNLYNAIMQFAIDNLEPNLQGVAKAIFTLIRPTLETSQKRYQKSKDNGEMGKDFGKLGGRPKKEKKPLNNPPSEKSKPLNDNDNVNDNENVKEKEDKESFLSQFPLTLADIDLFKFKFPKRTIDLDKAKEFAQKKTYDIGLLIKSIQASDFLNSANNMSLSSCLKHYDKIINGDYKNFTKNITPTTQAREYTSEELNTLFDNLDNVNILGVAK